MGKLRNKRLFEGHKEVIGGLEVRDCGIMPYKQALELQNSLCAFRRDNKCGNTVLIVEHPPVITLGARKSENKVLLSDDELAKRGIETVSVQRGGGTTAHNPGQIVFYPIIKLKTLGLGVNEYIRTLEQIGIELLESFGVESCRRKGFPGLWIGSEKIASIGVRLKRWVTFHGMAINFNNDLGIFQAIVPCGLDGVKITSVARQLNSSVDMQLVRDRLKNICEKYLGGKGGNK